MVTTGIKIVPETLLPVLAKIIQVGYDDPSHKNKTQSSTGSMGNIIFAVLKRCKILGLADYGGRRRRGPPSH
jgi:hypothetical protein